MTPLTAEFSLTITMLSDWHVGTGTGRPGSIDRLVKRDVNGLPFLPGKTLNGIWRDACERVALGLDDGNSQGVWNQWVAYLFGDQPSLVQGPAELPPRPAALSVRAAYFSEPLRFAFQNKPAVRNAITFVKPGVSIHRRTGRAKPDFLRFEEMARADAQLTTQCSWRVPLDAAGQIDQAGQTTATALLLAGVLLVERLGGKRRRGAGRCQFALPGIPATERNQWLDWIEAHPIPNPPPAPVAANYSFAAPPLAQPTIDEEWISYKLTVTPHSPLVLPERTVGNVVHTLDYLAGTYLLPFITQRLSAWQPVLASLVRSAIAQGDLLVTNATLVAADAPSRSVPFALYGEKLNGGFEKGRGVYNRLCEATPRNANGDEIQLKGTRAGFAGAYSPTALPVYDKPELRIETHNVVDDGKQRPEENGVYSYQFLVPVREEKVSKQLQPVSYAAQLRIRKAVADQLPPNWSAQLNGAYEIGRASKDDYGAVEIICLASPPPKLPTLGNNLLTVWLLSDLLLRDERLRPSASVEHFRKVLESELKVKLSERNDASRQLMSVLARQHRTDSWHTGWGLPRPSLVGLSAGSCFVFEIISPAFVAADLEKQLARLAQSGLGERRAEGYGQLSFNDPLLCNSLGNLTVAAPSSPPTPASGAQQPPAMSAAELDYARQIERAAVRQAIHRHAVARGETAEGREAALGITMSKPENSQLGALRSACGRLQSQADKQHVTDWLERVKKSDNRKDKWPDGLAQVEKLVGDEDESEVWRLLGIDFARLIVTPDGEAALKTKLWAEAVRALVDACVRAQKRASELNSPTSATTEGGV